MRSTLWLRVPSACIALCSLQCVQCFAPATSSTSRLAIKATHHHLSHHQPSTLLSHHADADETINHLYAEDSSSLRRQIILAAPAAASLLLPANAVAAETAAESIRLLSSKTIPGLGPPDIYYPPYFVGKWRVARVISTSDDERWNGINLPLKVISEMRFVPYDAGKDFYNNVDDTSNGNGNVNNPNNVPAIADRTFNEKSYYTALANELGKTNNANTPYAMPPIQSLNWVPTNPNVLSLSYTDGSSKEVKVTKRSSDVSKDGSGVFSTEFRRMTDVVPPSSTTGGSGVSAIAGGIPKIYKSRILTKWKQASDGDGSVNFIEGIEIVYNEQGTLGEKNIDPMLGGGSSNGAFSSLYGGDSKDLSDWRSTKTKILMERIIS